MLFDDRKPRLSPARGRRRSFILRSVPEEQADAARRHRLDRIELCAQPGEIFDRAAGVTAALRDLWIRRRLGGQAGELRMPHSFAMRSVEPARYDDGRTSDRPGVGHFAKDQETEQRDPKKLKIGE